MRGLVAYILLAFISERPKLLRLREPEPHPSSPPFPAPLQRQPHEPLQLHRHHEPIQPLPRPQPRHAHKDVKAGGSIPDPLRVQNHIGFMEDYLAALQDEGLSPSRVYGAIKHVRTFYRVNGVKLELSEPLSRRVTYKDRAPKPEELARSPTLGGFREETLLIFNTPHHIDKGTIEKAWAQHREFLKLYPFREQPEEIDLLTPDKIYNPGKDDYFFLWIEHKLRRLGSLWIGSAAVWEKAKNQPDNLKELLKTTVNDSLPLPQKIDAHWEDIKGFGGDKHIAKKIVFVYYSDKIVPIFKTEDLVVP